MLRRSALFFAPLRPAARPRRLVPHLQVRAFAADIASSDRAETIRQKLEDGLDATDVVVEDISGGCGAMYRLRVVSPQFDGLRLVQQHRLVKKCISEEISDIHGLTLETISES